MKKIHEIKEWFSLADAADRLSDTIAEPVSLDDLLDLAIEGKIQLFWYLRHQPAVKVEYRVRSIPSLLDPEVSIEAAGLTPIAPDGDGKIIYLSGPFYLIVEPHGALADYLRFSIDGWDDPEKELISIDGYYVQDEHGQIWNLREQFKHNYANKGSEADQASNDKKFKFDDPKNFFPSDQKPKRSELGFTRGELEKFEASLITKTFTEVSSRERNTLLKIIIGMATDGYGFDASASRSPLPKELEGVLDRMGIPVSDDTIRKWLKEAAGLLPSQPEDQ